LEGGRPTGEAFMRWYAIPTCILSASEQSSVI